METGCLDDKAGKVLEGKRKTKVEAKLGSPILIWSGDRASPAHVEGALKKNGTWGGTKEQWCQGGGLSEPGHGAGRVAAEERPGPVMYPKDHDQPEPLGRDWSDGVKLKSWGGLRL